MADEQPDDATEIEEAPKGVGGYLYRLALAGVGAVMLAQEELEARFKRRVETPSQEGAPLPPGDPSAAGPSSDEGSISDQGRVSDEAPTEPARGAFFSQIDETVATFLKKLVPGRAEMDALTAEIEALTAEVEALKAQNSD